MNVRERELQSIDQVLDQIRHRRAPSGERQGSAPVAAYLDPARFRSELEVLFRRFPLGLAHASEVAAPGAYVLREVAGVPVILLRGEDGRVRALLNACRHRGARLLDEARGCASRLVCPYHAWTYRNDGSLLHQPWAEGFADLDSGVLGLTEFPCAERCGVIWVALTPHARFDAACWFASVDADLHAAGLATHVVFETREVTVQANWKVVNDAFMEAYHFRFVHRNSVYPLYFDNQGVFTARGAHYHYFLPHRSILTLDRIPREHWRLRDHALQVLQLFPATTVQILPDHAFLHTLIPDGPGRTLTRSSMLIPEPADTAAAQQHWRRNYAMVVSALDEDHAMAERVQRGIASGLNADLHFGRYECGITHMHEAFDAALDGRLRALTASATGGVDDD